MLETLGGRSGPFWGRNPRSRTRLLQEKLVAQLGLATVLQSIKPTWGLYVVIVLENQMGTRLMGVYIYIYICAYVQGTMLKNQMETGME